MKAQLIIMFLTLLTAKSFAVTVQFPDEELANESVLPVFDKLEAVKERSVPTKGRFEIGPQLGFLMNEPFFNTMNYGFTASYHFNETHGVNLFYSLMAGGLNKNGESLKQIASTSGPTSINLDNAPQPESFGLLNYQITPYYGKISLFKDFVMNLSLYGTAGLGMFAIDGEQHIMFNAGLGQKFYLNRYIGIRVDLRMLMYQGPNVVKTKNAGDVTIPTKLPASAFETVTKFDSHMSVGLIFLL